MAPGQTLNPAPPLESAAALLRRIEWTVLKRLDGLLQGDHRTLMRGTGLDLADLREYQPCDDVRHIDWNVTARLGQPHVRQFMEDRDMNAWFLLDLSASVDFGSSTQTKRRLSREFVAVLARLLSGHGNRIGALLYGGGLHRVLPARSGRQHLLEILHGMQAPDALPPDGDTTRLHDLLAAASPMLKRRSTVFVVSDFISLPGWHAALGRLVLRHDVVAVRLLDPLELELPDLGLLTLRDAETGEHVVVDTHDAGFRRRFARIAAQREAELRDSLAQAGVDTLELSTDDDLVEALLRFVDLRRRRFQQHHGGAPARHLNAA